MISMQDKAKAVIFGCGCLTALGVSAVIMGINGTMLAAAMTGIGILVGYLFGKKT